MNMIFLCTRHRLLGCGSHCRATFCGGLDAERGDGRTWGRAEGGAVGEAEEGPGTRTRPRKREDKEKDLVKRTSVTVSRRRSSTSDEFTVNESLQMGYGGKR